MWQFDSQVKEFAELCAPGRVAIAWCTRGKKKKQKKKRGEKKSIFAPKPAGGGSKKETTTKGGRRRHCSIATVKDAEQKI